MNPHESYSAVPDRDGYAVLDLEGNEIARLEPGLCNSLVAASMIARQMSNAFVFGMEAKEFDEPHQPVEAVPEINRQGDSIWRIVRVGTTISLFRSFPRDAGDTAPPRGVSGFLELVNERMAAGRLYEPDVPSHPIS